MPKRRIPLVAIATLVATALLGGCATMSGGSGLTAVRSPYDVKTTIDRMDAAAKARNFAVVARVDHAAGAQRIGRTLRPTELLIFGNPQGGTPLMECAQSAGIDLPVKALAWQDASGQVMLGYNDPAYLGARHGLGEACATPLANMKRALDAMVQEAVKR
jgi:uncharacterized protein (DUF302 family)